MTGRQQTRSDRQGSLNAMVKITFKHWKTDEVLEAVGIIDPQRNNQSSDRLIVTQADGAFEDILKSTIIDQTDVPETD